MSTEIRDLLEPHPGCRSVEAALLLAQLRAAHERMAGALRDLAPDDLEWQPAPGMNTIGMLAAHVAVAETHLAQIGLHGEPQGHVHDVLGLRAADPGTPLPPGGAPPAALAGKDAGFFLGLLERALGHATAAASALTDADMDRQVERPGPGGRRRLINVRWVLAHMGEHLLGHLGQIQLLRHLRRPRP